jgi:hypothetical protein
VLTSARLSFETLTSLNLSTTNAFISGHPWES